MTPHTLTWANPTTNTDGSPYTQSDNAGYEITLDGAGAVGIPLAYGTSFDLDALTAYTSLKSGAHTLALRVVSKQGVASDYSAAVTFQVAATPMAPTIVGLA
jgi:hypothetical protein